MIEANEDIDLVTMRRQQELSRARASFQRDVSEGRMVVRGRVSEGRAAQVAAGHYDTGNVASTSAPLPAEVTEEQPDKAPLQTADPETAWRYTRLAITAGLVVFLLVVWIWQKRARR